MLPNYFSQAVQMDAIRQGSGTSTTNGGMAISTNFQPAINITALVNAAVALLANAIANQDNNGENNTQQAQNTPNVTASVNFRMTETVKLSDWLVHQYPAKCSELSFPSQIDVNDNDDVASFFYNLAIQREKFGIDFLHSRQMDFDF